MMAMKRRRGGEKGGKEEEEEGRVGLGGGVGKPEGVK